MESIKIIRSAKINLGLEIINKREDGYHNIESIMQEIDLYDEVYLEKSDQFQITSNNKYIPLGEDNLVYKAYRLLADKYNKTDKFKIHIEKNIPVMAGLAGGSADGAAVLLALNEMWQLGLDTRELEDLSSELGADFPFCIRGGTCFASRIGDKLRDLPSFSGVDILIINPKIPISTAEVYSKIRIENKKVSLSKLEEAIEDRDLEKLGHELFNRMEEVVFKSHPEIKSIKEELLQQGALGALMSGSGSSVFGIFKDQASLNRARDYFQSYYQDYIIIASKTI